LLDQGLQGMHIKTQAIKSDIDNRWLRSRAREQSQKHEKMIVFNNVIIKI